MNILENSKNVLLNLVKSKQPLLFRKKRKDSYSISTDRLLYLYQNYFLNIPSRGNYIFKFLKNDKNDLLLLFRVYFKMYVEVNNNLMTAYEKFPKRFKILRK